MQATEVGAQPVDAVFVGRRRELARLEGLLEEGAVQVLFVHGLAGAGKSALLRRYADRSRGRAVWVQVVDCRAVEPTAAGFFAALGLGGASAEDRGDGKVAERLRALGARAERVVLALDHYEVFRLLDTWLRQVAVPALPDNVRLLLVGREAPNTAWARLPVGTFDNLALGPLTRSDSVELLSAFGVDASAAGRITRFAGGHPLTLVLAALAVKEEPVLPVEAVTLGRLVEEFAHAYLDDLDVHTRGLLEAAAVVRRVTRPLLAAMLAGTDVGQALDHLRALPFVDAAADGLVLHESVQQAIIAQLRATDPAWHRTLRQRAWTYLRAELRHAAKSQLWRYTADMIYLIENPEVREAHFPSGAHRYAIEPATSADEHAIEEIIALHEPPAAAALLRRWWARWPDTFRVARDQAGGVAGFMIITTSGRLDPRKVADDPVVANWLEHLRREPIPASQELLLLRRWLTREAGDGPCDAQAACWLDLKRTYMQLRPRLRRNYGTTNFPEIYVPVMIPLGGGAIPGGAVTIDGRTYQGLFLEFGPSSVDGWLTRLAAAELGLPEDDLLDVTRRQLLIGAQRIQLTHLEFEVLHYLRQHDGAPVPRQALLADIWGYDADIGSNVVDVVIHALRKKLGKHSALIETVRGVGYRFGLG